MKKRIKQRTIGRKTGPRNALQKSLLRSLILAGKIQTTQAKAKDISPLAEKLVSKAKKGKMSQVRQLSGLLGNEAAKKLIEEIAPRYQERKGGYTRVIKLQPRRSDASPRAIIEFT